MNPQDNTSTPDPLQPSDDIFSPQNDEERLPEDNDVPSAPADDVPSPSIPVDYPTTDDGVDSHEAYDEGLAHAAGIGVQEELPHRRASLVELEHEEERRE